MVMKTAGMVVVAVLLGCVLFLPLAGYGMGWIEPIINPGGGGTGPVSAPEPGVVTLIAMALSGGAGYFLGKRKK